MSFIILKAKGNSIVKMSCCGYISSFCVFIVTFQLIKRILPWFYENLIGPSYLGPKINVRKMGEWAVVTGATFGIGKSYAIALAKQGLNIVLISRSEEKLENVAKEIRSAYGVEVKIITADFTSGLDIYPKIAEQLQDLDIGVLVNNVGTNVSCPEYFLTTVESNKNFLKDIIECNIHSVTHMTQLVLPRMVKKNCGVIINISSLSATVPGPLLSVYAGTKAFVDKFSCDLNTEYKSNGIYIQSVLPGFVCSNMSRIKKPTLLAPSSDTYATSALRTLGYSNRTTGYFPHAVMKLVIDMIAALTTDSIANNYVLKQLLAARDRLLKKATKSK